MVNDYNNSQKITCLRLDNLGSGYGYASVFSNVSMEIETGQSFAVTGPNGAGKTTLLRVIAGLRPEYEGAVYWDGKIAPPSIRRFLCHWISSELPLKRKLTVRENLQFMMALKTSGYHDDESIRRALSWLNIDLMMNKRVETLSAGQRMRVFLSTLLLDERPLWILDEPSSNLDISGRTILNSLIRRHVSKKNGIAVIATHDPALFDTDGVIELEGRAEQ